MKWSWSIGRIAGIDLRIHATFLLLLAWWALLGWQAGGTVAAALNGVLFIVLLFASVVAHELGHALAARRYGVGTRDITLLPIGGVAQLERMPREPRQEMVIALAGPAVTLGIIIALYAIMLAFGVSIGGGLFMGEAPMLRALFVTNVIVLIFNLLPAFPMDGGRVLRAGLAMRMDYVRATDIAAGIGKLFALLFGIAALLWLRNPLLVIIALFVWMGAAAEATAIQFRSTLGGIPVHRVMIRDVLTLSPGDTLSIAVAHILSGFQQDFPVVEDGHVVGVLTRAALLKALTQHGSNAAVADVMDRTFVAAEPGEPLDEAFARLSECRCHTMPVIRDGSLVGVLTSDNVGEFVMVESALAGGARIATGKPGVSRAG